jgi:hypothetical protein
MLAGVVPHELIHPNWHVVLIHYPLALLTLGLLVELWSLVYRRGTLRAAGRWMILLGALSTLPAATSGIYAYYDTVRHAARGEVEMEPGGDAWYQLVRDARAQISQRQFDDLKHHIWRMAPGTILLIVAVVIYVGASDRWRRRLYLPCLLLVLFAVGVQVWGAWFAGESIHVRGTAVERDATGAIFDPKQPGQTARGIVPPLQLHVLVAGLTLAAAVGALALSIRASVTHRREMVAPSPGTDSHDVVYADSPAVQVKMIVIAEPVHAGRFWILAIVLALLTATAGVWVAGWSWGQIKPLLAQPRDLAHVSLGAAIVVLGLMLAALARWGRGRRWWLALVASLLVAVVAGQVWMGILLMYDGSDGGASLYRFRKPAVQEPTSRPLSS